MELPVPQNQANALVADLSSADEERAEEALIAAATRLLRSAAPDIPADFTAALFSHAAPEDLMHYDPRQLAALAQAAWALLAVRKPSTPAIRIETSAPVAGLSHVRTDCVLEIVNDDMPFLLDSILGELAKRGLAIRFVVHPVFNVMRDASGHLIAFQGTQGASGALRESFIHIHLEPIDESRRAEIISGLER